MYEMMKTPFLRYNKCIAQMVFLFYMINWELQKQ